MGNIVEATTVQKAIIDAIYEDIPVSCQCPHCEREIDIACLIDPDARMDRERWIKMVVRVENIIYDYIKDRLTNMRRNK